MSMNGVALLAGSKALALREKSINTNGPCYVRLVGRNSGLIDWLLTIIGINTTSVFEVYEDRIEYSYGSLFGRMQEMIPLSKVSNLVSGYFKPFLYLIMALVALLIGIIMACAGGGGIAFVIGLVIAVVFFVCYHLQKSTMIGVIPNSASPSFVVFKRSLIENKNISEAEAMQIMNIINELVKRANS